MEPGLLALLVLAAGFAGFIDSIVGGGGVISLPALLATGMPPHLAVGTNKIVGTGASGVATWQYARAGCINWSLARVGVPIAAAASVIGALTVLQIPEALIVGSVSAVMIVMVAWVLFRPAFGTEAARDINRRKLLLVVGGLALLLGFYDGLLGPGTGTFLLFGLIAWANMPFLAAAANGRVINFGSNVGALVTFAILGNVDWFVGGWMALGTITGGYLGSRSSIKHGAKWIRPLFVTVALALLARMIWSLS